MKVKTSPLKILHFEVSECVFETIAPEEINAIKHDMYEVDIDFEILELKEEKTENFIIPMRCKINRVDEPLIGYSIEVMAIGSFSVESNVRISKQVRQNLKAFSSVNIMISNIRGFLRDISSYGPFDAYQLPSIDMSKLLEHKQKSIEKEK